MYGGGQQGGKDDAALMAALAMAAAQQEEARKKTKFLEAALPVALLAILVLIFAVKLGFIDLSVIPIFQQPVTVLILTDNDASVEIRNLYTVLQQESSYYKIKPRKMIIRPTTRLSASQLADADVVILYQVDDMVLTTKQRLELAKYVRNGGKLIVVLNSGTYTTECDVSYPCNASKKVWIGWKELKDFMPVECYEEASCRPTTLTDATLTTIDPDHPIMRGYDELTLGSVEVIKELQLSNTGVDIADIQKATGETVESLTLGITVSSGIFGTRVVHFNYDPWKTRNILINTILYLAGRSP